MCFNANNIYIAYGLKLSYPYIRVHDVYGASHLLCTSYKGEIGHGRHVLFMSLISTSSDVKEHLTFMQR